MLTNQISSSFSLREKIYNIDFVLLFSILFLGIISIFAQLSSSNGEFDYYAKSHLIRFCVFFLLFFFFLFFFICFCH